MINFVVITENGNEYAGMKTGSFVYVMHLRGPFGMDREETKTQPWYLNLEVLNPWERTWVERPLNAPKGLALSVDGRIETRRTNNVRLMDLRALIVQHIKDHPLTQT